MKFPTYLFTVLIFCSSSLAVPAPTPTQPPEKRGTACCTINLNLVGQNYGGLHTFTHKASITGTAYNGGDAAAAARANDPQKMLNDKWGDNAFGACGASDDGKKVYHDATQGWVVRSAEWLGIVGDTAIECVRKNFMREWQAEGGCILGDGSLGHCGGYNYLVC